MLAVPVPLPPATLRPAFSPFGREHFAAVAMVAAVAAAASLWGRRQSPEMAARGGRALGAVLVTYYLVESWIRVRYLDTPLLDILPLELCSALFFIGPLAHVARYRTAFDVVYFWTFAGTIHAMITPTPRAGFPDPRYFLYFAAHGLLILNAVYTTVAMRQYPVRGSLRRALLALQAWVILVGSLDWALGANFLYLRHKPEAATLFDYLGPWPWYIVSLEIVATLSFCLWKLPFVAWARSSRELPR